jgi:hypothetical protein
MRGWTAALASTFALLASGCSDDTCYALCARVASRLGGCLDEWGVGWEYFDAEQQSDFGDRCREQWTAEKSTLEPRQLEDATEDCTTAADKIDAMSCDEFRALYL